MTNDECCALCRGETFFALTQSTIIIYHSSFVILWRVGAPRPQRRARAATRAAPTVAPSGYPLRAVARRAFGTCAMLRLYIAIPHAKFGTCAAKGGAGSLILAIKNKH